MEPHRNDAQRLGEENITRLMIRFSLPSVLAMAVNASYNLVDTIFVGKLGSAAIAALSVALPIQMLLGAIAIGTGVSSFIDFRSLGAGNNEHLRTAGQVIFRTFLRPGRRAAASFSAPPAFLLRRHCRDHRSDRGLHVRNRRRRRALF